MLVREHSETKMHTHVDIGLPKTHEGLRAAVTHLVCPPSLASLPPPTFQPSLARRSGEFAFSGWYNHVMYMMTSFGGWSGLGTWLKAEAKLLVILYMYTRLAERAGNGGQKQALGKEQDSQFQRRHPGSR